MCLLQNHWVPQDLDQSFAAIYKRKSYNTKKYLQWIVQVLEPWIFFFCQVGNFRIQIWRNLSQRIFKTIP